MTDTDDLGAILSRAGIAETEIARLQKRLRPNADNWNPDPTYLRSVLERAQLSQRRAAQLVGIPERMFRDYMMGQSPCPYVVQYALEVLAFLGQ